MFTVVIVLHDSEPELRVLLDSVAARLPEPPQLVVVDSGSSDGGADLARRRGADVEVLPGNLGFGAACNAGVARARHDVTVLLNPDCELIDGSLVALAELARTHPAALHVPSLLDRDGGVQRSAHPLPGTMGAVAAALVHPPLLPPPVRDRIEPYRARSARTVGWAIAACLAGSTALLRRLGPFDPAVHLFGEDMELCLRARAAGVPTVLHPQLRLRHLGGHATLREGEPLDLLARRRREVIAATLGARALRADDAAQALTFASRAAGHALLGGDSARPRAQLAALRRARRDGTRRRPVLLVAYAGVLGGAERVLLDWAGAIAGPVVLACPEGPLAAAARARGIDVAALGERPLRLRGARFAAARSLAGLARDVLVLERRLRPSVVVASGPRPVLAAVAVRAPVVALHHDLPTGPLIARAVRWAGRRCTASVATSAAIADAVDPRAHVVHPGVDLAHWRLPPPAGPPRALVLGALVPSKRADLALAVAARVPGLELEVAGEPLPGDPPEFAASLRRRAARPDLAGRVTFSGVLEDPRPALERARCLLHCADREAFGLVLVEALAAGRPVVAAAAGGPAEILSGSAGGRLYAPGDVDGAARAVEAVLADADAPGAARAHAEARFDGASAARRFAAVVEALRLPTPQPAGPP